MADIIIVDDERDIRELVSGILTDEGYSTRMAADSRECMSMINAAPPALMILDIWLKDSRMDGIDILKRVKRDNPEVPVVIISGHGNIEVAVEAIKLGAYDFIEKPFKMNQLQVVVSRAMEASRLRRENAALRRRDDRLAEMIGSTQAFKSLISNLDKVTSTDSRVMLTGPSGCGKETAARYIHAHSKRANFPFVSVNCAAIEPERMEEVLFGRESAESGEETGLLTQAHGGVIYFDEVADMPLGTQSKIQRALIDQSFQRVGGSDSVRVDMRVISSTCRDLLSEIEAGRFREELYHRLNVVPVAVPSLEDRREDIPLFAEHFLSAFHRNQGLPLRRLSRDAVAFLQTMSWPGNVRQLRNAIERALILGESSENITAAELSSRDDSPKTGIGGLLHSAGLAKLKLREAREMFDREYLRTQLDRFDGNISRTADYIELDRSALHRKLKSLGISLTGDGIGRTAKTGRDADADVD